MSEQTYPYQVTSPDTIIEYFELTIGEGDEQQKWILNVFITQNQKRGVSMIASKDWNLNTPQFLDLTTNGYKKLQQLTNEYKEYFEQANNADEIKQLAIDKGMTIITEYVGDWVLEYYQTDQGVFARQIIPSKHFDLQ
jgi:hypothetical protein